jgi:hypothetical protein
MATTGTHRCRHWRALSVRAREARAQRTRRFLVNALVDQVQTAKAGHDPSCAREIAAQALSQAGELGSS